LAYEAGAEALLFGLLLPLKLSATAARMKSVKAASHLRALSRASSRAIPEFLDLLVD